MRIRLNKVIVGQGSGCSLPRRDVKENKEHHDNIFTCINKL